MTTTILSIVGALGGIAGIISLIRFLLTRKSIQKQSEEEADSVAIKNLKEAIGLLREAMDKRAETQDKEIEELKEKVKTLENEVNNSSKNLKICYIDKYNLEEDVEKMRSSLDIAGVCDYVISGHECPALDRYSKLFKEKEVPKK